MVHGNLEQHFVHCTREQHALGHQLTDTKSDVQIVTHLHQYSSLRPSLGFIDAIALGLFVVFLPIVLPLSDDYFNCLSDVL